MRMRPVFLALAAVVSACAPGTAPATVAPSASAATVTAPSASASATAATPSSAAAAASLSPSSRPPGSPTATPVPADLPLPAIRLERSFGALAFTQMTGAYQGPDGRWYVLEQPGRIMTFREGDAQAAVFLDIRDRVESGGEEGLLGFAFAPDFERSGVFFLDYTAGSPRRTVIASFVARGTVADRASQAVVLEIGQPFANHNGGQLAFGPDGYLYIGMGDGGSGGDPMRNGQNTNVLLAKVLRIDVSDRAKYRVPPDNPFAGSGGRGEIWAYGLRNPWRFSFDTGTGTLWLADVGQDQWEEIDIVTKGGNYGWNVMEGTHCYRAPRCETTGLAPPVFEYGHSLGCSVTGGFVYRGSAIDALRGAYVYADYCSGRVWGLRYQGGKVTAQSEIAKAAFQIGSFAQDQSGELYVLQYASPGAFYRIAR